MANRKDDRLFNPNGRKHFRRTYSLKEVRYSLMVLIVLVGIAGWVMWLGAHPDPGLLALETELLDEGSAEAPARARKLATGTAAAGEAASTADADGRGPVPPGLAAPGWRERGVSVFERDNLYEKINGRAGYYESFDVKRLHFVTLLNQSDESLAVDIEMYDHGNVANALGAYAGERQPGATPELTDGTLGHMSRNAMFLVRGRFYVRAIGGDESEPVLAQLAHLREVLSRDLEGEALPWAYSLFLAADTDPGQIGFLPENAFSFGFAKDVYTVQIDADGAELFAVAAPGQSDASDADAAKAAEALARQFTDGFSSYGTDAGTKDGVPWIEDQYLNTLAGVTTHGALVLGVRGAADRAQAESALAKLVAAARGLPDDVLALALAGPASDNDSADDSPEASGGYGEDSPEASGGYGEDSAEPGDEYGEGAEPAGDGAGEPAYPDESGYGEPSYDQEPGATAGGAEPNSPEEYR